MPLPAQKGALFLVHCKGHRHASLTAASPTARVWLRTAALFVADVVLQAVAGSTLQCGPATQRGSTQRRGGQQAGTAGWHTISSGSCSRWGMPAGAHPIPAVAATMGAKGVVLERHAEAGWIGWGGRCVCVCRRGAHGALSAVHTAYRRCYASRPRCSCRLAEADGWEGRPWVADCSPTHPRLLHSSGQADSGLVTSFLNTAASLQVGSRGGRQAGWTSHFGLGLRACSRPCRREMPPKRPRRWGPSRGPGRASVRSGWLHQRQEAHLHSTSWASGKYPSRHLTPFSPGSGNRECCWSGGSPSRWKHGRRSQFSNSACGGACRVV